MKQLTDTELKEYAVSLLDKQGLEQYEQFIEEHEQEMKQDCERSNFHDVDVPAECENFECINCTMTQHSRRAIDCPYAENKL